MAAAKNPTIPKLRERPMFTHYEVELVRVGRSKK
jgi:hypothetical protein